MVSKQKVNVRLSNDRGLTRLGWLLSRHTFSFGDYFDRRHVRFRSLRVINEDYISPNSGFGMHGHRDMEIVTIVFSGVLEHRDSLGNRGQLQPGDVQVMTAGLGIEHSEANPSESDDTHLMQIWIEPRSKGLLPRYEQRFFPPQDVRDRLCRVAGPMGRADQALSIEQDVHVYTASLNSGTSISYTLQGGRAAWLQVVRGSVQLEAYTLGVGDACSVEDRSSFEVSAIGPSQIVLFDLL